VSNTLQYVSLA